MSRLRGTRATPGAIAKDGVDDDDPGVSTPNGASAREATLKRTVFRDFASGPHPEKAMLTSEKASNPTGRKVSMAVIPWASRSPMSLLGFRLRGLPDSGPRDESNAKRGEPGSPRLIACAKTESTHARGAVGRRGGRRGLFGVG